MDPEKSEDLGREPDRHSPDRDRDITTRQSRDLGRHSRDLGRHSRDLGRISRETGRQSRDQTRTSVDIENLEGRIGAIVKSQKSGHSNRRKSSEKDASERQHSPDSAPPVPTVPPAAYKESVEVPDFRFSMASDGSDDMDRDAASLADRLQIGRPTLDRPTSARTQNTGRTLPELTRIETKLAQKEAHPW